MIIHYSYLDDQEFLKKIDELPNKTQYLKIVVLNWQEEPIESIQGKVRSGSINIDGNSAMRRAGNLSMSIAKEDVVFSNFKSLVSIGKKIQIEIGFDNCTNQYQQYKQIWFPQGVFVITSVNLSHSVSDISLSLSFKDKMCLLNGECGGQLPASVNFHEVEVLNENGEITIEKPLIFDIIKECVQHYGGEDLSRIIISDIDRRVRQVMKWIGGDALYKTVQSINNEKSILYTTDKINSNSEVYEYGRDIGYILTDFVFPSELIGNAGDNVCTILDKIRDTLGNYEYFYDVFGNFIFQEKKNYLNTSLVSSATGEQQISYVAGLTPNNYLIDFSKGKAAYTFSSNIITSFANNPSYENVKNDFIVWGVRQTAAGNKLPIRYHLAIDKKPKTGIRHKLCNKNGVATINSIEDFNIDYTINTSYDDWNKDIIHWTISQDWRTELLFQGVEAEITGTDYNEYYIELMNEWPKIYNIMKKEFKDILPYELDYWLDFIDTSAAIGNFSIDAIGKRSKIIVDESINCIFEPEIPDIIVIESGQSDTNAKVSEATSRGLDYTQVSSEVYSQLATGGTYNSAFNLIKDLLYQYTNYNEQIQLSCLPIYHLEPNICISAEDLETGIYGNYVITSMSLPLSIQGTMSISATRALTRI